MIVYASRQRDRLIVSIKKTKASYLICLELAKTDRLLNFLNETRFIATTFDESFSKVISKEQMEVLVRFWNTAENRVSTRYINRVFMGKVTAPAF